MTQAQAEGVADQLLALLEAAAGRGYFGEPVTQLEHALQAAELARAAGADDDTVLAALLHDVGHLLDEGKPHPDVGIIDHDETGARYLRQLGFSERIAALVGGHVNAKRYLVTANPGYRSRLSAASTLTLELQGGAMGPAETTAFASDPHLPDRLRLRLWDEQAKVPGRVTAPLFSYRDSIVRHLTR